MKTLRSRRRKAELTGGRTSQMYAAKIRRVFKNTKVQKNRRDLDTAGTRNSVHSSRLDSRLNDGIGRENLSREPPAREPDQQTAVDYSSLHRESRCHRI